MKIERRFTTAGQDPYAGIGFVTTTAELRAPDGRVLQRHAEIEVPEGWSQAAAELLAQRVFRRTSVPGLVRRVREKGVPEALWRAVADEPALARLPEGARYGAESSARQVFDRLAGAWASWGWKLGLFDAAEDALAYLDETRHMLARQMAAPELAQWAATGLHWAYGLSTPAEGLFHVEPGRGRVVASRNAHLHPRLHAGVIQSVRDDLLGEGGIMALWRSEAQLLSEGRSTAVNLSDLACPAEGRGTGLVEALRIGDRAAAAIPQGMGPRRIDRRMICDIDHPEIGAVMGWKLREEQKVASLVAGAEMHRRHLAAILAAVRAAPEAAGEGATDPALNPELARALRAARAAALPEGSILRALQAAGEGAASLDFPSFDTDWDTEAHASVAGQHSAVSVRLSRAFLQAVAADAPWPLRRRADGGVMGEVSARALWRQLGEASWAVGAPSVLHGDTIEAWNTVPASGPIRATSLSGETAFLDDSAVPGAEINLRAFESGAKLDAEGLAHACRLWTLTLEISVAMAGYPSAAIAARSHATRPLGLGLTGLGGLMMRLGLGYDSAEGRALCGALAALVTGTAYATSARMAAALGPFADWPANAEAMLRVIRNHRRAALGEAQGYEALPVAPVPLDQRNCPDHTLLALARAAWDAALAEGMVAGFRNAQVSRIAADATLAVLMDCDTPGIAPETALVKTVRLGGGGHRKVINPAVPAGLAALGYGAAQIEAICAHALGHGSLARAPAINHTALIGHGFGGAELDALEAALPQATDIRHVFNQWTLGAEFCTGTLGIPQARLDDPAFDMLCHLGFTRDQVARANAHVCGAMTLEGAPFLNPVHTRIFDCVSPCGPRGRRALSLEAQLRMMAAAQGLVSGGVARALVLPQATTAAAMAQALEQSHALGLKVAMMSRENAALSQAVSGLFDDLPDPSDDLLEARDRAALEAARAPEPSVEALVEKAAEKLAEKQAERPGRSQRDRLPERRKGYTQKALVGGHKVYLRTGEYRDGRLGEIFIDMHKEGAAFRAMMNNFAIAVSVGLQYGVPLEDFVDAFTFTRFEPSGPVTGNEAVKSATSILDYVFRELAISYLDRTDLAHVAPAGTSFGDLGGGSREGASPGPGPDPAASKSLEVLRQISSTGYLRNRLPQELVALPGGAAGEAPATAIGRGMAAIDPALRARLQGFEGEPCHGCGNYTVMRAAGGPKCATCGRSAPQG